MVEATQMEEIKQRKRNRKRKTKISFDEETITKAASEKIALESLKRKSDEIEQSTKKVKQVKKKKSLKEKREIVVTQKSKKRNANKVESSIVQKQEELDPKKPEIKGEESIRAKKRRKHQDLMQQNKNKVELEMQQKCLNYLSLWKHGRESWKFEKLKQIWLQQSILDEGKIPEEFFTIAVDYFNNGKGKVRNEILNAALKIVNEDNNKESEESKENEDDAEDKRYERARTVVQNLQE